MAAPLTLQGTLEYSQLGKLSWTSTTLLDSHRDHALGVRYAGNDVTWAARQLNPEGAVRESCMSAGLPQFKRGSWGLKGVFATITYSITYESGNS